MKKICVFAGTTEGRQLVEYLQGANCNVTACVATEYGKQTIDSNFANVKQGRMGSKEMEHFFAEEKFDIVVDATHPFAQLVTENIYSACQNTATEYLRINRDTQNVKGFMDAKAAIEYLQTTNGNILLTTGSKEIKEYSKIENFAQRVYARVLPLQESIEDCLQAGLGGNHIIAMQGPFSKELNCAIIKDLDIKILVTKNSGNGGGFKEKLDAAAQSGIRCVVINPPSQLKGFTYEESIKYITEKLAIEVKPVITIIGMGTGNLQHLTRQGYDALQQCDAIIGARRLTDACTQFNKPCYNSFLAKDVIETAKNNPKYKNIAVVMSGDIGFYSGAKKMYQELKDYTVNTICGISTPVYFCSLLKMPWDNLKLASLHGRKSNIVNLVKINPCVFTLVGGTNGAGNICKTLCQYNLGFVKVNVGENLGCENQKITTDTAENLKDIQFSDLSAVIIENQNSNSAFRIGIPDEDFIRIEKVPMTKAEVRAVSISKLELCPDSVVYDIGAGTGSVSIECAQLASNGTVYAIEKNENAIETIEQNKIKFGADNIEIVSGTAPQAMEELENPTHAFLGGTSGNMQDIISLLLNKNPNVRIVINTIALESLAQSLSAIEKFNFDYVDIVNVNFSKSQKVAKYNMMQGQNPIYIITCQKR